MDEEIIRGMLQLNCRRVLCSRNTAGAAPLKYDPDQSWREKNSEMHPFREIMVLLSGKNFFQLMSYVYPGEVGDIVLVDSFERHDRYSPPGSADCLALWMLCFPNVVRCGIYRISNSKNRMLTIRFEYSNSELISMLHRSWNAITTGKRPIQVAMAEINGVVGIIMAAFAERIMSPSHDRLMLNNVENHQYRAVMDAISYVDSHLGDNPRIGQLAHMAGYSTSHFARLFREYSGYGFREYIDWSRFQQYRAMSLRKMHKKEIAAELGFSSTSSLIHWLRTVSRKYSDHIGNNPERFADGKLSSLSFR